MNALEYGPTVGLFLKNLKLKLQQICAEVKAVYCKANVLQ